MSSWRSTTLIEMQTRLLAAVPALATVGLYNGQDEAMKGATNDDQPYKLPAVFIAFVGGDWYREADLVRYSDEYIFRIYYIDQVYQDDMNHSSNQAEALAHLDRFNDVINALDQYTALTYVARFHLLSEVIDEDRTHIVSNQVEFYGKVCDPSLAEADTTEKIPADDLDIVRTGQSQHEAIITNNVVLIVPPDENQYQISD